MFGKALKYSYVDKKNLATKRRWIFLTVLLFFVIYILITNLFFSMRVLENRSMLPSLNYGDRFIFSSTVIKRLLPELPFFDGLPAERGSVVLVNKNISGNYGVIKTMLNKLVRFFSANKIGISGVEEQIFIKRVAALPGDTISMTNYVLRVRTADSVYTFTEFELSDRPYEINIPNVPAVWDESLPFSGSMEETVLGEDEFFVLSDDRSNTNDSRTWGPIPSAFISGKAVLRYWPVKKIGFL
ncbi:MAG: signal peptidase I [Spirochaetaceae bacterium]|jgi:signal peptidase I|nr:signal peptidase I [Spirochaetaceae bacterium]